MASLMQTFAIARKQRRQACDDLAASMRAKQQSWQQEQKDLGKLVEETLNQSRQERLAGELVRRSVTGQEQQQRFESSQERAELMKKSLQQLQQERLSQSAADQQQRQAESQARTLGVRLQLQEVSRHRQTMAQAESFSRKVEVIELHERVQAELATNRANRLTAAAQDQGDRRDEANQRRQAVAAEMLQIAQERSEASVKDAHHRQNQHHALEMSVELLLNQLQAERQAMGNELRQDLREFRQQLHESVWGNNSDLVVVEVISPVATAPKPAKSPAPVITAAVIDDFVINYVASLPHSPSLGDVMNDREQARELLAQGANKLGVDPSEILNALLRLAEL